MPFPIVKLQRTETFPAVQYKADSDQAKAVIRGWLTLPIDFDFEGGGVVDGEWFVRLEGQIVRVPDSAIQDGSFQLVPDE